MSTAGPNAPGTMAKVSGGDQSWSSEDDAKTSNNSYAFVNFSQNAETSWILKATNFGFTIPTGSTINGVTVAIERKANQNSATNYIKDLLVQLYKGGTLSGDNKADTATKWPTSDASVDYGGADVMWGNTLSAEDVNDSTFGVGLRITGYLPSKSGVSASVDFITVSITYTEAATGLAVPVLMHQYRQRRL